MQTTRTIIAQNVISFAKKERNYHSLIANLLHLIPSMLLIANALIMTCIMRIWSSIPSSQHSEHTSDPHPSATNESSAQVFFFHLNQFSFRTLQRWLLEAEQNKWERWCHPPSRHVRGIMKGVKGEIWGGGTSFIIILLHWFQVDKLIATIIRSQALRVIQH